VEAINAYLDCAAHSPAAGGHLLLVTRLEHHGLQRESVPVQSVLEHEMVDARLFEVQNPVLCRSLFALLDKLIFKTAICRMLGSMELLARFATSHRTQYLLCLILVIIFLIVNGV
jgi:hypothetical protein